MTQPAQDKAEGWTHPRLEKCRSIRGFIMNGHLWRYRDKPWRGLASISYPDGGIICLRCGYLPTRRELSLAKGDSQP